MAKSSLNQDWFHTGYTVWSVRRTIDEARNIARWSPWKAHEWMKEARNRLDLYEAPFHQEYNYAVREINDLWRSLERYSWFNKAEFWSKGKVKFPATYLEPLYDE